MANFRAFHLLEDGCRYVSCLVMMSRCMSAGVVWDPSNTMTRWLLPFFRSSYVFFFFFFYLFCYSRGTFESSACCESLGIFAVLAIVVSFRLISQHMLSYTKPTEQVRLCCFRKMERIHTCSLRTYIHIRR